MSALHHAAESIHVPVPVAAIAPHLLHSPTNSPHIELSNYIDPEPPQSLAYSQSELNAFRALQPEKPSPPSPQMSSPNGMLVVHSYSPMYGPPGTQLTAQVDFTNLSGANVRLRIVFGDLALPTSVTPTAPLLERPRGQEKGEWTLKITIPPTGQATLTANVGMVNGRLQWPLTLQALDSGDNLLDSIAFGLFSYENYVSPPRAPPMYDYRNRPRTPPKRPREQDQHEYSLQKRRSIDTDPVNLRRMSIASDSQVYMTTSQHVSSQTSARAFFQSSTSAPISNSGFSVSPQTFQQQPLAAAAQCFQTQTSSSPPRRTDVYSVPSHTCPVDDVPALIRTSKLADPAKSEQANVALQDDLESMKHSWSEAEKKNGRRLVQFWKRQTGTTLQISFVAIPQSAYKENTIVVSCIYRENVDDYFITSVDVIYLLEALAGSRFEVEEKNRIRRNLEGFKPTTISKSKPGTEDFFRIIMEFPPPRPRNIEKDVKVFEWGKLKLMLEKVFSKYSTVSSIQLPPVKHEPSTRPRIYTYPQISHRYSTGMPRSGSFSGEIIPKVEAQSITIPSVSSPAAAHIPIPSQNPQVALPDALISSKYSSGAGGGAYSHSLSASDYYDSMRLYDIPAIDFGSTNLLSKSSENSTHHIPGAATGVVPGDMTLPSATDAVNSYTPESPASSDNSPLSMTLSISSGGSSDGPPIIFDGNANNGQSSASTHGVTSL